MHISSDLYEFLMDKDMVGFQRRWNVKMLKRKSSDVTDCESDSPCHCSKVCKPFSKSCVGYKSVVSAKRESEILP